MRAIAAPVTFSVVRTRYAAPAKPKRHVHPLAAIFAPLGVAIVLIGAGLSGSGYSFAADETNATTPPVVSAGSQDSGTVSDDDVIPDTTTANLSALSLVSMVGGSASVEPLTPAAEAAVQTDTAVKQAAIQAAAAKAAADKLAAEQAAQLQVAQQQAAAQASAGKYASFDTTDGNSVTQNYQPNVTHGQFIWPVNGVETSPFGYRSNPITGVHELHSGIDLAVPCGTPIHASAAGIVVTAGWGGSLGNYTEIAHGNGLETGYGHQMQIIVSVGQQVAQGQVIGYVGHTGAATGCHVHFLAAHDGAVFQPLNLVK